MRSPAFKTLPKGRLILGRKMQVEHHPTCARIAIPIQVKFNHTYIYAGDNPIGNRRIPFNGRAAACDCRWGGEINGSPGLSGSPAGMRTASIGPDLSAFKRKAHFWLLQAPRDMRFEICPGVAKQGLEIFCQTIGTRGK